MEKYSSEVFHSTLNLFEDEVASPENLKYLLKTPVGYNSSDKRDTMLKSMDKIKDYSIYPAWVDEFYKGYKCIEKLIILAQKNRY
jgi:hypothetical protein